MADYKILESSAYANGALEAEVKAYMNKGYILGDYTVIGNNEHGNAYNRTQKQVVYKPNPGPGFVNNKLAMRTLSAATPAEGGGGGSRKRKTRKSKSRK
jgi:hypothetical protein